MTVAELGRRMSSAEFSEWMAYAHVEPVGPASNFTPPPPPPPPLSPDQFVAVLKSVAPAGPRKVRKAHS